MNIDCFIISWRGQHENAAAIADCIGDAADGVSIVFSDEPGVSPLSDATLIRRPNHLMWSDKFAACLDHFRGDVMLIIHADCHCEDWAGLVHACRRGFNTLPQAGLWAPLISGTPWNLDVVAISDFDAELTFAAQTDGIVFALHRDIVGRMRGLRFEQNVYGWGIDWAMVAACYDRGYRVVINRRMSVTHPVGHGYSSGEAHHQMQGFLTQLTPSEAALVQVLNSYCFTRQTQKVVHRIT